MMQPAPHSGSTPSKGGDAQDEFMIVRPELVRRLGSGNAAIMHARIEFRCNQPGLDRIEDETGRWWRASMATLSVETGLTVKMARTALDVLERHDAIETEKHCVSGVSDRTVSYRISPLPAICPSGQMDLPKQANGSSSLCPDGQMDLPEKANHHLPIRANVPLFKELQEGVGRADGPDVGSPAAEVAPPVHCSKHIDNPTTDPCRGCGDARRERERWDLEQATAAKVAISARARQRAELLAEAIDECDMCDERGYLGIVPCEHNPERPEINRRGMAQVRAVLDAKRKAG